MLPAADTLYIDQIVVYLLHCPISDAVHPQYPQHLILGLELLCDALTASHLRYQFKKHVFCLLIQIGKIII